MSDSDRPVLPEWAIHLRNLIDRVVPVVQKHHSELEELQQKVAKLERVVAQQSITIQQQSTTIGVIRAQTAGNGPTV